MFSVKAYHTVFLSDCNMLLECAAETAVEALGINCSVNIVNVRVTAAVTTPGSWVFGAMHSGAVK